MNFWGKLNKPFFVLAPMADVTDAAFRKIILECGRPEVFYTEFISADGLMSAGRERLMKDLLFTDSEHPIVAQFFGSKPENFYGCAKLAQSLGFDGVDINMGCPDRKVVKQGAGIGLCKTPELAREVIQATIDGAGGLPVSVKTRIGLHTIDLDWIKLLLETGIAALVVHGRTMKEMSKVPAHWDVIGQVVDMAKGTGKAIIGNGDIMTREDGLAKAEQYGVDGIMVGRGIFQNPWFFSAKGARLPACRPAWPDGQGPVFGGNPEERLALLLQHTLLFKELWGDTKSFDLMKKFYKVYVSGWDGAKDLRTRLMNVKNEKEVEAVIEEYLSSHQ